MGEHTPIRGARLTTGDPVHNTVHNAAAHTAVRTATRTAIHIARERDDADDVDFGPNGVASARFDFGEMGRPTVLRRYDSSAAPSELLVPRSWHCVRIALGPCVRDRHFWRD